MHRQQIRVCATVAMLLATAATNGPKLNALQSAGETARLSRVRLEPWPCVPGATGGECVIPSSYRWFYRTTNKSCAEALSRSDSCFRPLDPNAPQPADVAQTETTDGRRLPFVVRVERGSINRTLYDVAVLFVPGTPRAAWNGRVVWSFGGGTGSVRGQTPPVTSWANEDALAKGFMSVVSGLTDGSINANRVLSAETVLQARARIARTYGPVRWLIGEGCSAGSMQLNVIASMYPGLVDGALLACTFPDTESNTMELTDSWLLGTYFASPTFERFSANLSQQARERKMAAIAGHKDNGSVTSWGRFRTAYRPGVTNPSQTDGNNCRLPNALVYDRDMRPNGIRCTTLDHNAPLFGQRGKTKLPERTLDNIGVQYGWRALLAGTISGAEFVALNREIGGIDRDAEQVTERQEADRPALRVAYTTGLVADARQLINTPIIDLRGDENSSVHSQWNSFALRARLRAVDPTLGSYAMWRTALPGGTFPWTHPEWRRSRLPARSLLAMDEWLSRIAADTAPGSRAQKVRRNRPPAVRSFCIIGADYAHEITDEARCDAEPSLAYYGSIRMVAGAPIDNSILKCRLRPLDAADYAGRLSAAQLSDLRKIFPSGVCDWRRPGIEQQPARPWHIFAGHRRASAVGKG